MAAEAVLTMVSAGVSTGMVMAQPGSGLSNGQVLPGSVEVTKLTISLPPVSGLRTVTE